MYAPRKPIVAVERSHGETVRCSLSNVNTNPSRKAPAPTDNAMATAEDYMALRSAVGRLLDPRVLGGFRVLGLERGVASSEGESPVATWWAAVAPVG